MSAFRGAVTVCVALFLAGCEIPPSWHQAARPLDNGSPVYPRDEQIHGRGGTALVDCGLTEAGTTTNCVILAATAPDFAASALAFVSKARYAPALEAGHPVAVLHHTYQINYTIPPWTFTVSALCDVKAAGTVQNCRPTDKVSFASWPTLKAALERSVASPHMVAGQAVDQNDRPVSLIVAVGKMPLTAPLPDIPGDSFLSLSLTCSPAPVSSATQSRCVEATSAAAPSGQATHLTVRVGIIGLVTPDMGDFSR